MKRFLLFLLVGLMLFGSGARAAPDEAVERAFKAGNALMEKRDYAGALAQYQIVIKAEPDAPASLWNAGSAAFFTGDFKLASTYFARLQKQDENDGAVLAKRLQTAQELGDLKARDALRDQIFALHREDKDTSGYTDKPSFCRDQFFVGKDQVLAFEYWELKPLAGSKDKPYLGRVYEFFVVAPDDSTKIRIECGWSSLDVEADGSFVPSRQMPAFYYDAYYPSGPWSRRTFGLEAEKPSFEDAKKEAIAIIEGRAEQVSGKKRDDAGGT